MYMHIYVYATFDMDKVLAADDRPFFLVICIKIYLYKYAYTCTFICLYICGYKYMHTFYIATFDTEKCLHLYMYICICICIYKYTYVHIYIYIYIRHIYTKEIQRY
jgi:hypothetical protein